MAELAVLHGSAARTRSNERGCQTDGYYRSIAPKFAFQLRLVSSRPAADRRQPAACPPGATTVATPGRRCPDGLRTAGHRRAPRSVPPTAPAYRRSPIRPVALPACPRSPCWETIRSAGVAAAGSSAATTPTASHGHVRLTRGRGRRRIASHISLSRNVIHNRPKETMMSTRISSSTPCPALAARDTSPTPPEVQPGRADPVLQEPELQADDQAVVRRLRGEARALQQALLAPTCPGS